MIRLLRRLLRHDDEEDERLRSFIFDSIARDRNPVHEYFWPDCKLPLPHAHHAFTIGREE